MSKEELIFCPLGGSGEIGGNMNLYAYGNEKNQKWIIVDTGDFLPTTQMSVALFAYFLYFINAFQFLRKLRLARQTDQKTVMLENEVSK